MHAHWRESFHDPPSLRNSTPSICCGSRPGIAIVTGADTVSGRMPGSTGSRTAKDAPDCWRDAVMMSKISGAFSPSSTVSSFRSRGRTGSTARTRTSLRSWAVGSGASASVVAVVPVVAAAPVSPSSSEHPASTSPAARAGTARTLRDFTCVLSLGVGAVGV
ncbi:hypothetical protein, partial [Corynebacterium bovis]